MATFDSLRKNLAARRWGSLVAAGLLSLTMYGCGGSDNPAVAPPPPPPPPAQIDVAAVIAAAAANPANDAAKTADNPNAPFAAMNGTGLAAITINSPPVINFTVFDNGHVITGLTTSNVRFGIAKLVPGANGSKDEWQNYIQSKKVGGDLDGSFYATTDPRTDAQLVYNAAGYYTYTFQEDITDKDRVTAYNQLKIAYEPGRTHRLAIQLRYTDSTGATVKVNPYIDFTVGADGVAVPVTDPALTRQVVNVKSCNSCHEKLAIHGGNRVDTQFCVVCHNTTTVLNNATGFATSMTTNDFPVFIHKIHMSEHLPSMRDGTPLALDTTHDFSDIGFPQDVRNCTKCHTGDTSTDPLVAVKTAQGNNWYERPSRAVCGSCHDGIDFATSATTGVTISGDPNPHTSGTFGLSDDGACVLCHGSDKGLAVKLMHRTPYVTPNNADLPADVKHFSYDLQSVAIGVDGVPTVKFRILDTSGAAILGFNAAPATKPADYPNTDGLLIDGIARGPSVYVGYALAQDGVNAPADFTAYVSRSLADLWTGGYGATAAGTLTVDGSGVFTAVLSSKPIAVGAAPGAATLATGAIRGYFKQTDLADYPYTTVWNASSSRWDGSGGRNLQSLMVSKLATAPTGTAAYKPRRAIVDTAKCNQCHDVLGSNPGFHSGASTDATLCAVCHNPNKASSGWTAGSVAYVHGIHAAEVRTTPFVWHDLSGIRFPGDIGNCSTCHLPNTINSAALGANRVPYTVASGIVTASATTSPFVAWDGVTDYGALGADTNLVSSPIAATCTACHDDSLAISHIKSQGGSFYETRVAAKAKAPEACLLCHGAGKIADIKVKHGQ